MSVYLLCIANSAKVVTHAVKLLSGTEIGFSYQRSFCTGVGGVAYRECHPCQIDNVGEKIPACLYTRETDLNPGQVIWKFPSIMITHQPSSRAHVTRTRMTKARDELQRLVCLYFFDIIPRSSDEILDFGGVVFCQSRRR